MREQDRAAEVLQDFSGTSGKPWAKGGDLCWDRGSEEGEQGRAKQGSGISNAGEAEGLRHEDISGFPPAPWLPTACRGDLPELGEPPRCTPRSAAFGLLALACRSPATGPLCSVAF